ncbi:hypothetical protein ACR5MH_0925 (plasmid) [Streptomyces sp. L7]|uniref:hypothetical protein n=1 Tax=Streptomyces sp. L7 TaxID=3423954 RepID=UPI000E20C1ED|nr:hypothetical protein DOE76_14580 [Leifsonia sp. ku-ls]
MNALDRGGIRRWVVLAISALTVVFALLLAHMFETAHPTNETTGTATSAVVDSAATVAGEAAAAVVSSDSGGVPHDQMLVLGCVLGLAAAALALALFVCLLRRDVRLARSRVVRSLAASLLRERPLVPSLESLAISRT